VAKGLNSPSTTGCSAAW